VPVDAFESYRLQCSRVSRVVVAGFIGDARVKVLLASSKELVNCFTVMQQSDHLRIYKPPWTVFEVKKLETVIW